MRNILNNITDIKNMPNFNSKVTNGVDSVSKNKVYTNWGKWADTVYVKCRKHGAMLCVSQDRRIYRCSTCNEGAYKIHDNLLNEWRQNKNQTYYIQNQEGSTEPCTIVYYPSDNGNHKAIIETRKDGVLNYRYVVSKYLSTTL